MSFGTLVVTWHWVEDFVCGDHAHWQTASLAHEHTKPVAIPNGSPYVSQTCLRRTTTPQIGIPALKDSLSISTKKLKWGACPLKAPPPHPFKFLKSPLFYGICTPMKAPWTVIESVTKALRIYFPCISNNIYWVPMWMGQVLCCWLEIWS